MITDSSLDNDARIYQLRPTIATSKVGNQIEEVLRGINYGDHSHYSYGKSTTVYQEVWYLPRMNALYHNAAGMIYSAPAQSGQVIIEAANSNRLQYPYAFCYNQATGLPTFVRNAISGFNVSSSYRMCTFETAPSTGWGVDSSKWALTSGSYSTTPWCISFNTKDIWTKLAAQYSSSYYAYLSIDFVGVILKSYTDSKIDTTAGMEYLLTERKMQTRGGTISNFVYGKNQDSTAWNMGYGNIQPLFENMSLPRSMFYDHTLLLTEQIGTDKKNLYDWMLYCTPVIPTKLPQSGASTAEYGIRRPCIRVSLSYVK
jgi:hypothetical protein